MSTHMSWSQVVNWCGPCHDHLRSSRGRRGDRPLFCDTDFCSVIPMKRGFGASSAHTTWWRIPFWSTMQERDLKWKTSPVTKQWTMLKKTTMELLKIDVASPTWRASCWCRVPTTCYGDGRVALFKGRRRRLQLDGTCIARWGHKRLLMFGPLKGVIPYDLRFLSV